MAMTWLWQPTCPLQTVLLPAQSNPWRRAKSSLPLDRVQQTPDLNTAMQAVLGLGTGAPQARSWSCPPRAQQQGDLSAHADISCVPCRENPMPALQTRGRSRAACRAAADAHQHNHMQP